MAKAVTASSRPAPPVALREPGGEFVPAHDLAEWISATFIESSGHLANPDHEHLQSAAIGCLWTNVPYERQMRTVLATAEIPTFRGSAWQRERQERQMIEWFGDLPQFVITVFAPGAVEASDAEFCALVEHELYHCGQAKDDFGSPKFKRDGTPVFAIRGHDVEEFVGVVERYGVGAAADGVAQLVEASKKVPTVQKRAIGMACGTCQLRLA